MADTQKKMLCLVELEVDIDEIEKTLERLEKAKDEIYQCYSELKTLGVVKIAQKETPVSKEH
ncbi:MAG: hypothetical protein K2G55_10735, partial [Lachnospiraceae bacterium]|nr:hypothetical protein [Lachnospiraceae bacterium]MDE7203207.1 hypothetical protein [Lachnospiraceae bacterium]